MSNSQPPPHIAQRLAEEQERYSETSERIEQKHHQAEERHQEHLSEISKKGHDEVEHAKHVAQEMRTHHPGESTPIVPKGHSVDLSKVKDPYQTR